MRSHKDLSPSRASINQLRAPCGGSRRFRIFGSSTVIRPRRGLKLRPRLKRGLVGVVHSILSGDKVPRTRSSDSWDTKPGKFDTMNFRWRFKSSTEQGIPDLQPTDFIPECLAAWNMPRHRDHAAENGGALHFYLDDYRFETAWSAPERLLPRVLAVGASLTPDFSVWRDIPRASQIWNTYRSRWCGAFWQLHGVQVIPTVGWGAPNTYDFCFDGIPEGSVVSVSDVGMKNVELDKALFRQGMRELVARKRPKVILAYGRLRYCDSLDLPDVREYPTYWDRRRKQISEWENEEEPSEEVEQGPGPVLLDFPAREVPAVGAAPAAKAAPKRLARSEPEG